MKKYSRMTISWEMYRAHRNLYESVVRYQKEGSIPSDVLEYAIDLVKRATLEWVKGKAK